ncbi:MULTISPECIES: flagellar biosynthetic protein FliO [Idiomarinaceae]|uniref:Flagellar protein n=1 Tax=Pseudidiomarina fusca TaxID=2965078 RepID=A0ABU3KYR0_9GAMM|nr:MULTISPECIES: flagellar biosynthetic protein FliO [Idiomarinaceae]MDT7526590.1 flagellar biosynthetic protein FliO [Pseudidiomarina sp. GXY010]MRJ42097.1 flagellar biosynthetic protein FliO [Idiomarina sp. FeN1]NCU57022.1 flagellar biosynthetic protein FliO [Idiomarina sp. FenA--70]NCU59731.1 flagellar biosynthetic protein FliO [Idiomarina sp. FenBw--71]UUN13277.1 flagellar biosynthetic protein FliO [Idiomarina loihiensis]
MQSTDAPELATGMALLGQVTLILLFIIAVILVCAWVFRKLSGKSVGQPGLMQVVGSLAIGQRERVVIVAVKDTWLVLGVTNNGINKLHEMPAQALPATQLSSFAARFQAANSRVANPTKDND